jgi:2-phospho-L-lactate guanylyltransferase
MVSKLSWTAIVPIKPAAERKTRLATLLGASDRHELSEAMFAHVIATLRQVPGLTLVQVLSSTRIDDLDAEWIADQGRGLNLELVDAANKIFTPLLVVHADLPELEVADVTALMSAGEQGIAVAPDRHRTGTNALAARDASRLVFQFGPGSFLQHCAAAGRLLRCVDRTGLANDVDLPEDIPMRWLHSPVASRAVAPVIRRNIRGHRMIL